MKLRRTYPALILGVAAACAALLVVIVVELHRLNVNMAMLGYELRSNVQAANVQDGKAVEVRMEKDDPTIGRSEAPVKLFVFMDFECPYCDKFFTETLGKISDSYAKDGKVLIVFKQFPLPSHPHALPAAKAAECARQQGHFWEMAKLLFENQKTLSTADYNAWARQLGLDGEKFSACFGSADTEAHVMQEAAVAKGAGIAGTPALVVGGRLYMGEKSFEEIKKLIDDAQSQCSAALSAQAAYGLLKKGSRDVVFLDVRTPEEYKSGHIRNSINIDVQSGDFLTKVLALEKGNLYVVYCRTGARSQQALETMQDNGFTRSAMLTGGVVSWTTGGFPLEMTP